MNWVKKGLIYNSNGNFWWNKSHAQEPVADIMGERIRIYYSSRSADNKSYTSFLDIDHKNPKIILYKKDEPILELGEKGTFDDSGIMPSCILSEGNLKYLYYTGWHKSVKFPYLNGIGVAVSEDNGLTYDKVSDTSLFKVDYEKGEFYGTPFILNDNGVYRMWYFKSVTWIEIDGYREPKYNIWYAESDDGINWNQLNNAVIDFKDLKEGGISSPCVVKEEDSYKMWYSYRGLYEYRTSKENSYRIGYAESEDGLNWIRKDKHSLIDVSDGGWDSEMVAYPNVITMGNKRYMFYNGNGFGKTGFGYAVSEIE